jgi:hypothetical protein
VFDDMVRFLMKRYRLDEDAAVEILLELPDLRSLKALTGFRAAWAATPPQ